MKLHGWKHLGGSVYEHRDGTRVHLLGLCRLPSGTHVMNSWPESQSWDRFVRINGGNTRRGAMAWARDVASRQPAFPALTE
jgi:hypothetical protein